MHNGKLFIKPDNLLIVCRSWSFPLIANNIRQELDKLFSYCVGEHFTNTHKAAEAVVVAAEAQAVAAAQAIAAAATEAVAVAAATVVAAAAAAVAAAVVVTAVVAAEVAAAAIKRVDLQYYKSSLPWSKQQTSMEA